MANARIVAAALLGGALLVCVAPAASADPYFEGNLRHRPRLAFDGRDAGHTARVVGHIQRNEAPWSTAYARLRNLAKTGRVVAHGSSGWSSKPDPYDALYGQETRNGRVARAKAAVVWLATRGANPSWRPLPGGTSWLRQQARDSARIIEGMYDAWPCYRGFKVIGRGIVMAASLTAHGAAYDLLEALPGNLRPSLGSAERRLGNLAADVSFWLFTVDGQQNNHTVRVASSLGYTAIALNRYNRYRWWNPGTWYTRPKDWMRKAERRLHPARRRSAVRYQAGSGAWAEGTSYLRYTSELYLPFTFAYTRFLRGGGVPYLRSGLVSDVFRWSVDLRLPDGRRPAIDNAVVGTDLYPAFFLSQAAGGARSDADRAAFMWDVEKSGYPGFGGSHALDLLAAFDPSGSVVAQAHALAGPRSAPSRSMPTPGEAVLRSGWGAQDACVVLVAEHSGARKHGRGHESVDNGAYTFYAHGDLVAIAPGYAGFSQVDKTNGPTHTSTILVDGKGPKTPKKWLGIFDYRARGNDAFLRSGPRTVLSGPAPRVLIETAYERATIARTAALVGDRYLLLEDRCRGNRGRSKRFTAQVHPNAGAAKSRPLAGAGSSFTFETNRKRVRAAVGCASTASLQAATRAAFDAFGESPRGHDAIDYHASGADVTFLTAIAADPAGAASPAVRSLAISGAAVLRIEAGGRVDIAISNPGHRTLQIPGTTGTSAITTSVELAVVSFASPRSSQVLVRTGSGTLTVHVPPTPTPTPAPSPIRTRRTTATPAPAPVPAQPRTARRVR